MQQSTLTEYQSVAEQPAPLECLQEIRNYIGIYPPRGRDPLSKFEIILAAEAITGVRPHHEQIVPELRLHLADVAGFRLPAKRAGMRFKNHQLQKIHRAMDMD